MTAEQIDALLETRLREASKVLAMDDSHSATRSKLQQQVATDHRAANANSSSDYYDYPYVEDVYGDGENGTVVYSQKGQHTAATYKSSDKGYKLSGHKSVKKAYVTDSGDKTKESAILIDGEYQPLAAKEAALELLQEELIELREAAFDKNGYGMIKMIAPGQGSTAFYSPEVLKEAVAKGVFDNAQMFMDHATDEEEAARPEGSVTGLAAKGSKATYEEAGVEGPGVYTKAKAYDDTRDFLNQRSKDIGVSIRALGRSVKATINGVETKVAKSINVLKSADFVTRAGAGGKLVPLLESYRLEHKSTTQKENSDMAKIEIDDQELGRLKESAASIPGLVLQMGRTNERLARRDARDIAAAYFTEAGLPVSAQKRLSKAVGDMNFALPLTEGVLDEKKFTESLKTLVEEEVAYLKESGATVTGVKNLGDKGVEKTQTEDEIKESAKAADKEFDSIIGNLSGFPRKEKV